MHIIKVQNKHIQCLTRINDKIYAPGLDKYYERINVCGFIGFKYIVYL